MKLWYCTKYYIIVSIVNIVLFILYLYDQNFNIFGIKSVVIELHLLLFGIPLTLLEISYHKKKQKRMIQEMIDKEKKFWGENSFG